MKKFLCLLGIVYIAGSNGSQLDALLNGDVSIKAENGNLWSVVDRGYENNIEALKKVEADTSSLFTFDKVDEDHVYIKSKENGKYLSRINGDFIEAARAQPDVYCKFKVTFLDENVVVFQADTGKYLSRVWLSGINNILSSKTAIDPYCKFTFQKVESSTFEDYIEKEIEKKLKEYEGKMKYDEILGDEFGFEEYGKSMDKRIAGSQLDALLNGDVSIKAENGNLWSVVDRGYKNNIEALKKLEADTSSLFTFEKVDEDHVLIKSKENGKYLSRINRGIDFIEAAKAQPDVYCKFKVTFLDENVVVFQADTGKYLSRVWRSGINNIESSKTAIDPYCKFTFEKEGLGALLNGDVSIRAENGNLWSVVDRGYKDNIEALKKVEADTSSLFTFEKVDEDHVYIKSKENGKYLSRINRGIDFIEAAKAQPDVHCKFKVTFLDENVVVFQADTGKYLSRVWRSGINNIEPSKTDIDPFCKFTFEKVSL